MDRDELIRMFVLDAIADDYEDLSMIYREAGQLATKCGLSASASEIKQGVLDVIRMGLAKAYQVSPTGSLEEMAGPPSPVAIEKAYVWVTQLGRQLQLSDYADWPFDESGSLKKGWSSPER